MADKEYLLGNRARELLKYTNQVTKVVTDDVSQKDVRAILQKIAALDDIREVKSVCQTTIGQLDRKDKEGALLQRASSGTSTPPTARCSPRSTMSACG